MKFQLQFSLFFVFLVNSINSQTYKLEYAQKLSSQFNFVEAYPVWEDLSNVFLKKQKGDWEYIRQAAKAAEKSEQYEKALYWIKILVDRNKALAKLLPHQKNDFKKIFKVMNGLPVTIRLLDPPLHEFLPKTDKEIEEVANSLGMDHKEIKDRTEELHEQNPMLGHRGCRLGISFPEIYEMQCEAIFEALVECKREKTKSAIAEIMIPLISTDIELKILRALVDRTAKKIEAKHKTKLDYIVGTMIELPRAALQASEISKFADFFSFGTNDLTQTTFGISRDDSGKFLNDYINNKIFEVDPFVSLDQNGVGELIKIASSKGRQNNKNLKLGICGEHGGDPKSIEFCSKVGLNYVSCSPFRVPIARLTAAQAEIKKLS